MSSRRALFNLFIEFAQILILIASAITTMRVGMGHLDVIGIISIAFDWMAMFLLIIIYRDCSNGYRIESTGIFQGMLILVYLCVMFESGSWLFDGLKAYRMLNSLCNIGANCTVLISAYFYLLFILQSPGIDKKIFPWIKKLSCVVMIIGIVAEFGNYSVGYFYTVNSEGVYARSEYGSLLGYVPFLIIILCSIVFITKQKTEWSTKWAYMSYCILPLISSVWYTVTGLPPSFYVAVAASMLLIHSDIYLVQSKLVELLEINSEKKEAEYALSQNKLMLSQIKPHFIYNVLGSIEVLCKLDPEKAARAVHHFSHYFRSNMDVVKNEETIPFSRELEHIRNYIWLEKMRFGDDIDYKEEIDVTDFSVPQLAIQPIVENSIKHGMMGKADDVLHVLLKTKECDEEYIITISDDGCGFDSNDVIPDDGRSHIGIHNSVYSLQMRLNGTMHIESKIGVGTNVIIRIPKTGKGEDNDNTGRR